MSLSDYPHLAACLLAAAALAAYAGKNMDSLTARSPRQTRQERVLLAGIVAVGAVAIYGSFLLGSARFAYTDVGSDTVDQYVPMYVDLIERVANGSVGIWNFNYGLGSSALSYQSWVLDPFNALLIPLGLLLGSSRLWFILAAMQVVKIAVSAFVFDNLLKRYCEVPLARVVGATAFGFGGFLLLWGQHYWLGSMYVLFSIAVLCAEKLMGSLTAPKFLLFAACAAVSIGWSPYCGFMIMLGCAFYCLMRIIAVAKSGKEGLRLVARLALAVLCGALISAVTFIPYAVYLAGETSRVDAGGASAASRALGYATGFVPLRWIPMLLSRLLGDGLISCGAPIPDALIPATESFLDTNCYEFANLGFGAGAVILIGQSLHWAVTENKGRARAAILASAALCVLFCINEFLPALFNILVLPKYRASFVLAIPICAAMAIAFEKRVLPGRVDLPVLAASGMLTIGILLWSLANSVNAHRLCALYLLISVAMLARLLIGGKIAPTETCALVVAALLVASSVADGFFVTNNRVFCTENSFPARSSAKAADTEAALAYIASTDTDFYRVEKLYDDWTLYNDALAQGYAGVNSYNSTIDNDLIDFYRLAWPDAVDSYSSYQRHRLSQAEPALLSFLGVRYVLSHGEVDYHGLIRLAQFGDVVVYKNEAASPLLFCGGAVIGESELKALADSAARQAVLFEGIVVPDDRLDELQADKNGEVPRSGCDDLTLSGSSELQGTLSCEYDSVACLTVPHTDGWKVTVDGEEVETFRADIGFIGFRLPAGEHVVTAHYECPGLGLGLRASAFGCVLLALACLAISARARLPRGLCRSRRP